MARSNEERIRFANEELLAKGNLAAADSVFAVDYVVHADGKDHKGLPFVRRFVRQLRTAIPDLRVNVEVLTRTRDRMVWQRTLSGTHAAALKRIPPSGRRVKWNEMFVSRFDGGKIAEEWMVSDLAGQLLLKLPARR